MATASSRRPARRRNNLSDIEDDAATQRAEHDDVQESDEEPTSRRVKKEKRGKKQVARETNDASDSDSDEAIDIENFPDQPLEREQMDIIRGLGSDWQNLVDRVSLPFDKFGMAAGALADLDDDDAKAKVEMIDRYMRESLDCVAHMKAHKDALDSLRQKVLQGEKLVDIEELYSQAAKTSISSYNNKTTRQKYAKHDAYAAFKSNVWESQNPGTGMPPITEQIPREPGDNSDEDDDLEIGGITQNYNCPITLTLLDDPYTSSVCGHSFSAAAIRATFRTSSSLNKCPAAGCNKSFRLVDCKPNKDLAKKVKAHKRRLEREQDDSDAEEVID